MKRVMVAGGVWIAVLLLVSLSAQSRLAAQGTPTPHPVTNNDVNRVSRGLYCPVCQNIPLEVCETAACERWRSEVRDLLAQGKTDDEIRQYFINQFGVRTVGTPSDTGTQLLTIALPFGLIGLIGIVIAVTLLHWRRQSAAIAPPDATIPLPDILPLDPDQPVDDYRARMEKELRSLEK